MNVSRVQKSFLTGNPTSLLIPDISKVFPNLLKFKVAKKSPTVANAPSRQRSRKGIKTQKTPEKLEKSVSLTSGKSRILKTGPRSPSRSRVSSLQKLKTIFSSFNQQDSKSNLFKKKVSRENSLSVSLKRQKDDSKFYEPQEPNEISSNAFTRHFMMRRIQASAFTGNSSVEQNLYRQPTKMSGQYSRNQYPASSYLQNTDSRLCEEDGFALDYPELQFTPLGLTNPRVFASYDDAHHNSKWHEQLVDVKESKQSDKLKLLTGQ